jgi:hypothetical protein
VVVAVPAPDGLEAVDAELSEQLPVEGPNRVRAMQRAAWPTGDVVLGAGNEAVDD